jgi:hypothetical protein
VPPQVVISEYNGYMFLSENMYSVSSSVITEYYISISEFIIEMFKTVMSVADFDDLIEKNKMGGHVTTMK